MKTVLCALNSQYIHSSPAPWALLAGIERYCTEKQETAVVESNVNRPDAETLARLCAEEPDAAGFCCYIWNIGTVRRLVPALREKCPGVRVVLGGPEAGFRAKELLGILPEADFIVCGEGERPFALLLDALAAGKNPENVPGLCFRLPDGGVRENPPEAETEPPSPLGAGYLDRLGGRIAYLETSRGCPFSCGYCLSGATGGVRFFPLERAKRELLLLARSGSRTVKLVDRTFNCSPGRAYEIFRFLIEKSGGFPAGVRFHFEVAADLFDDRTLRLLASAPPGLFQFEAGIQSFNEKTLEAVGRRTDLNRLCENVKTLLRPGNAQLHLDLIAGLPYEDLPSFIRSFDRAWSLGAHMLQLGFLKLLHGSRLRAEAAAAGCRFSPAPPYEFRSGRWLSEEDVARLKLAEGALTRLSNSGRFPRTLALVLEETGLSPFALFEGFGGWAAARGGLAGVSLDSLTSLAFGCFLSLGVSEEKLRESLICDRLSCDNTGRLPPFLRLSDARLKETAQRAGGKGRVRAAALPGGRIAVADYEKKDPVTGRYPVRVLREPGQKSQIM